MSVQKHIALVALIAALTACGGGGSDDSPAASSSTMVSSSLSNSTMSSSSSTTASSQSSSSPINSSQSSSSQSSVAALAQTVNVSGNLVIKNEDGLVLDNIETDTIRIDISLLNADQQILESNTTNPIDGVSGEHLGFSDQLTASDAKFVVVHISKSGFTDYARRFDLQENIELSAELSELPQANIGIAEAVTASGEVVNGFNFSVQGNLLGESNTATGKELTVFIPESALPAGTTSLDVQMKAFDPTDPAEAAYFPGAYEDSDGNKLLSIAFNYTDVTTNQGVSLQQLAQQTRNERIVAQKTGRMQKTEASEPVIINRLVPVESCYSLATMGDSDATQAGFQIPVYTYNPNSGLWDLLGQGSLFNESGDLLAANFTAFDCDAIEYTLEIKVTNEIFISNWWNLDYPLVFEEPVTVCAKLKLLDEGGSPLIGTYVYAFDDDDQRSFSASGFISDSQGEVRVSLVKLSNTDTDSSAKIQTYSLVDGVQLEKTIELSESSCESTAVAIPVTLSIPARCSVEGKMLNNNATPAANVLILGMPDDSQENTYVPSFAYTDNAGNYTMNLFCNLQYDVVDYLGLVQNFFSDEENLSLASVNVNAVTEVDETSDNGKKATLKDLTHVVGKPWGVVTVEEDNNTQMFIDIYYAGTDFPVNYQFDLIDAETNEVVKHFSGTLNESDFVLPGGENITDYAIASFSLDHGLTIPETETYLWLTVNGDATDAESNKGVLWGVIFLSDEEVIEEE
jgi:hypothetical protein